MSLSTVRREDESFINEEGITPMEGKTEAVYLKFIRNAASPLDFSHMVPK